MQTKPVWQQYYIIESKSPEWNYAIRRFVKREGINWENILGELISPAEGNGVRYFIPREEVASVAIAKLIGASVETVETSKVFRLNSVNLTQKQPFPKQPTTDDFGEA